LIDMVHAGAMLASLVVMGFLGTEGDVGATLPQGMSINAALGMEVLFSAILIFVTLNVAERAKVVGASAAIAVGVLLIALTVIGAYAPLLAFVSVHSLTQSVRVRVRVIDTRPLSGASMNPFRSLAPALLAGGKALDQVWIYIVGPLIGAVIAVLLTCSLGVRVHPYAYNKATGTHHIRSSFETV
jgi:aquaporin Z